MARRGSCCWGAVLKMDTKKPPRCSAKNDAKEKVMNMDTRNVIAEGKS